MNVNKDNFETEVIQSKELVIVDFGAAWCGSCSALKPVMTKFEEDHKEYKIAYLDADENSEIVKRYGVKGLPTVLLFKDGNVIGTKVGMMSYGTLQKFVEEKKSDEHINSCKLP